MNGPTIDLSEIDNLKNKILSYFPNADIEFIKKAFIFSREAHSGQFRRSGEAYIFHPIGVAEILADLKLDLATIATGLLHDTVEDTGVTLDQIEKEFGPTVRQLVDGVTKISQMSFRDTHEKQGENIRKMIVAMGKDMRVILVKLADRLHNMRTLNHMPFEKQTRIGLETLDIYAPLASRLGINSIKIELEDLAFRYTNPEMYYSLAQKVSKKKKEREKYIEDVKQNLIDDLSKRMKANFRVQGRSKHLYSIFKKMTMDGVDYEHVYDVLAFRVVVESMPQCYEVLGHIHSMWKPIPGRFKDYIAMPKVNQYQSLHTSVIGPGGERIEIQIRTEEMHLIAERGIAAHWSYKEGGKVNPGTLQQMGWLQDLVNQHQVSTDSGEFLENIKTDLFETQIYVFTPKGEVKELPEGATAVDFAFAVHTDVGIHCVGARINGKQVPLKAVLRNGDTVEVTTSKLRGPSKDWLKFCKTSKAKSRIRAYIQNEERVKSRQLGEELLEKEFRKHGYNLLKTLKPEMVQNIESLKRTGANDLDDLFVRVGYGKLLPKQILEALDLRKKDVVVEEDKEGFFQKIYKSAVKKDKKKSRSLITVDGLDDVLVRFGKCCNPIPGDPIRGFITLGRGITIHKSDCQKVFTFDSNREVEVEWTVKSAPDGVERIARVRVISGDTPGLLKSMSEAFASLGMNIHNAQVRVTKDGRAVCLFDVAVKDTHQLNIAIQNLQKIKGILGVSRVTQV
ncbi:MAG: bifunctional (p)ppGpp synthetase/guanosine-3',5'-bis(diphosphate) 3'-pyrophosphohydrolase [Bdellovibrionales bacterium]|nr:bifunctional (p)ppGpp synthetase/guanosine-3',5'-bis(diphosphate) 3'-pyrophosphohydrolase [Bdellovibrionales bacterium]